ncbi:MAG: ankyrin repeat domain-containing protein [Candidatus Aureabacteria bacterium]|nr:ankyrin repeat domain-containing protein [Candidatus Auribacterota bacterium]
MEDYEGRTALSIAKIKGYEEIVNILKAKGARDIPIIPLEIVLKSDINEINSLIKKGANVNNRYFGGITPLMISAIYNDHELADFLIKNKAIISLKSQYEIYGFLTKVDSLNFGRSIKKNIKSKSSLEFFNNKVNKNKGFRPINVDSLMLASELNSYKVAKLLLDNGADVNAKGADNKSVLMRPAATNYLNMARLLIKNGADINLREDEDFMTALMAASFYNSFEVAQLFIKKGADVNARIKDGSTALMIAVQKNYFKMVKLLIDNGADVNVSTKNRYDENGSFYSITPLMAAVEIYSIEIARLLIESGADIFAENEKGETALTLARRYQDIEIMKMLEDKLNQKNFTTRD